MRFPWRYGLVIAALVAGSLLLAACGGAENEQPVGPMAEGEYAGWGTDALAELERMSASAVDIINGMAEGSLDEGTGTRELGRLASRAGDLYKEAVGLQPPEGWQEYHSALTHAVDLRASNLEAVAEAFDKGQAEKLQEAMRLGGAASEALQNLPPRPALAASPQVPSPAATPTPTPSPVASPTATGTGTASPTPPPTTEQATATVTPAARGVPMFRGNPAHTGENPGPGVERSPKLLWGFSPDLGVGSSPAVVDGTVYIGSWGSESHVCAVDAATGEERWRFQTGWWVSSTPAVADGVVYFGSQDSYVYALDAATGEERWHFETGDPVVSSPAVVDGVVYIGSFDGHMYALDAATGEERWRFETDDAVTSSPAVVDGVLYVGGQDGYVYALGAASGEERWRFETGGGVDSSPAVVEGVVYVGSADSYIYALDAATGEERWRFETNGAGLSSPAVVEGLVYIGSDGGYDFLDPCGGGTPYLYALDSVTGEERWRFETGCHQVLPSPAVVDGVVYMGGGSDPCSPESPYVYALDAATGEERWRLEVVSDVSCSPAVVDGVVYICTGSLYAITEE